MCKCIQYKLPAEQKTKHLVYTGSTHLVIIQLVMMYYYTSTSFEKVLFCEPKLCATQGGLLLCIVQEVTVKEEALIFIGYIVENNRVPCLGSKLITYTTLPNKECPNSLIS
ncbi:Uncharacterized protein APZ42_025880 [Daphnia magna]|uniref:Uncharacterized protein n=1 Tax=Daphnia magna TaxID=35525 RepID=A0A164SP73_9CRUS|nr:Uncharacterized protein APZ42_025880 [Daphnia magna]